MRDPTLVPEEVAAAHVNDEVKGVAAALNGAREILVERAAEDSELVGNIRET